LALGFRIALLFGITWIIGFSEPPFTLFTFELSGKDLILLSGGIFLIFKSTMEIHQKMEGEIHEAGVKVGTSIAAIIGQIVVLDIIFSFDSILTAVGLTNELLLMIIAVIIALIVMLIFSGMISEFIARHPSLEVLALSFLILIGFMLMIESFDHHVPKGYIYFAVFFSLIVEVLNIRVKGSKSAPVKLKKRIE